jgi:hypothetical protein
MTKAVFINDKEIINVYTYRYQGGWLAKWGVVRWGDQMDE